MIPVVVPARFRSSRLPGKPLVELCGVPMVVRTCRQCLKVLPDVWVATDDERIRRTSLDHGIRAVLTPDCPTGTDRVAAAARLLGVFRDNLRYRLSGQKAPPGTGE